MSILTPKFTGETPIESPGSVFLSRFADRVQSGLLMGKPDWRSRYVVTRLTRQELAVRASNTATAINVGLNEVNLRLVGDHAVEYLVRYGRWAGYVVGLGAMVGTVCVVLFVFWDIRSQLDQYTLVTDPATNKTIVFALFWGLIVFWALVWPWILIIIHRPFARKLLHRIIHEVDMAANSQLHRS